MFKRLTGVFLVIFMITILLPSSLTKVLATTNGKASVPVQIQVPKSVGEAFKAANDGSSISVTAGENQTNVTGSTLQTTTIKSTLLTTTTSLNIPSLTQWVLDEPTNTLYAVSQSNKTLYFINAATMTIVKSLALPGSPTDIIKDGGCLYIALDDINQIAVVDMASKVFTRSLFTASDPYRVVKDGNKLYYTELDQGCRIHAYDLSTNTEQVLSTGFVNEPDLAINTDKHILYIGESGSMGSNMIYYSLTDNKVICKTNYNHGYGYLFPSRCTLFDGVNVYYAGRDFTVDNPQRCIGDFGDNSVIFAKNNFVFTNSSIYNAATHVKLGDYGSAMDLIELSGTTIYLYSSATGSIKSYNNSNIQISSSNIISLISGTAAVPIQSNTQRVQENTTTYSLQMNSTLTQWVLDEATNTLYGISKADKALFFVNATTLNLEKSITFTSGPTDIIIEKGKLYVALDDANQVAVVDTVSRQTTGTLYTKSDPYRIVIDGNNLYYAERDQWCDIYEYNLMTNFEQKVSASTIYEPDLAINTDQHILYIGESELDASNMTYYSTINHTVIGKTNTDINYGFQDPQRYTLYDGELVYYASRDFDPENPTNITGSYGGNIIFAKYGLAFTNTSVYSSYTNELVGDLGAQIDLAEISNRTDFYFYNIQEKSIVKIEPTTVPPVINSVSPNTGSVKGGSVVNITGTGFTGATNVYFGDTLGTNLKVNSDTSITVNAPSSSGIGYVDIVIEGPNGTNVITRNDRFTYTGLTVKVTAANGSVTGLQQSYNLGAAVTLTATAAEGYTFNNWTDKSGKILSTNPVYSFTINDNVELVANFVDSCDINKDGKVDVLDLTSVAKNYNMNNSNTGWVSSCDLNKDQIIDIYDLTLCSKRMAN